MLNWEERKVYGGEGKPQYSDAKRMRMANDTRQRHGGRDGSFDEQTVSSVVALTRELGSTVSSVRYVQIALHCLHQPVPVPWRAVACKGCRVVDNGKAG